MRRSSSASHFARYRHFYARKACRYAERVYGPGVGERRKSEKENATSFSLFARCALRACALSYSHGGSRTRLHARYCRHSPLSDRGPPLSPLRHDHGRAACRVLATRLGIGAARIFRPQLPSPPSPLPGRTSRQTFTRRVPRHHPPPIAVAAPHFTSPRPASPHTHTHTYSHARNFPTTRPHPKLPER